MKKVYIYQNKNGEVNISETRHFPGKGYTLDVSEKEYNIYLQYHEMCIKKWQPLLDKENEDAIIMDAQYGSRNEMCFIEQVAVKLFTESNKKTPLIKIKEKVSKINDDLYRTNKTVPSKDLLEKTYKLKLFT